MKNTNKNPGYKQVCVLMGLFCLWLGGINSACADEYIPAFYKSFNEASFNKDYSGLMNLLCKPLQKDVWSFGAGLGPTDNESLQMQVVKVLADVAIDTNGELKTQYLGHGDPVNNPARIIWEKRFQIPPSETDQIIILLNDKSAPTRWLGIYKSKYSKANDRLIEKLKAIVEADPYVTIIRTSSDEKSNQLPGADNSDMNTLVCPLRLQAAAVLKQWGIKTSENQESVGRAGAKYLLSLSEKNSGEIQDIIEAVQLLSPNDPTVKAIKTWPTNNAKDSNLISTFQDALKK